MGYIIPHGIISVSPFSLFLMLADANHTKSYVGTDPIVLPNGRVYGQERLLEMSRKVGCMEAGKVKDPTTGDVFDERDMKEVYIM